MRSAHRDMKLPILTIFATILEYNTLKKIQDILYLSNSILENFYTEDYAAFLHLLPCIVK